MELHKHIKVKCQDCKLVRKIVKLGMKVKGKRIPGTWYRGKGKKERKLNCERDARAMPEEDRRIMRTCKRNSVKTEYAKEFCREGRNNRERSPEVRKNAPYA